eukprot:TRINITY_DN51707_c0_g1_i1.p1 TRINITY_DN51707_c0_g1~~TRINITY_DN51707_c0_g1_i1.p1  ORF type:complete len:738 (+),score=122.20 TRINITY_DN51707_c0_g1_i1:84-2297(+)
MADMPKTHTKRSSIQMLQEMLGVGGTSRVESVSDRRKQSLSAWESFKSVDWAQDAKRDWDITHADGLEVDENAPCFGKAMSEAGTWIIPAIVGVLTATSGTFIEYTVEWVSALRFGYCPSKWLYATDENCEDWVMYSNGWVGYAVVSTLLATISATMTWAFAPMAKGSGIPEIKTILGGFSFPQVLAGNTLVVKIIGLSLSVGAGLSCGKEGPLVHIACCWSSFICKFAPRYAKNEAKQRELLSCACAAGVAVAFGAPLGGVLFSLEEASTIFPNRTMLRAFFASSVAAVTLSWYDPTGTGKLTMFEASYDTPPAAYELFIFILIGVIGGCVGSLFIHYNVIIAKARAPGTPFRKYCHIILEVALIALLTGITSYPLYFTQVQSNVGIRAMFHSCEDTRADKHKFMLDLCDPSDSTMPMMTMEIVKNLLLAGFIRYVQMTFTFGTGAPAGLFIPSLYTGAAIGRVIGMLVSYLHITYGVFPHVSRHGVYAMIGAASVLGGVCRVTISLVVIMFELTDGIQMIVPFMFACFTAKWVGDYFCPGIYDYMIMVRKYPFLHEPSEETRDITAGEIMDGVIDCIHPECGTVGSFVKFLQNAKYGGYPLTVSPKEPMLLGYLVTGFVLDYLEEKLETDESITDTTPVVFAKYLDGKPHPQGAIDLSHLVDHTVYRCVKEQSSAILHNMFRNLGIKMIMVTERGNVVGIITKKAFIKYMEDLHHGGNHREVGHGSGNTEALLPK